MGQGRKNSVQRNWVFWVIGVPELDHFLFGFADILGVDPFPPERGVERPVQLC
jgi:hypothetical protein